MAGTPATLGQQSSSAAPPSGGKMTKRTAAPPRTSPRPTVSSERVLALEAVSAQVQRTGVYSVGARAAWLCLRLLALDKLSDCTTHGQHPSYVSTCAHVG